MAHASRRNFLTTIGRTGAAALGAAGVSGIGLASRPARAVGKKITARLVLDLAQDDPRTKGVQRFADLVAKYTDNHVEVQIFPNDILTTEAQAIRLMRDGSLSMATVGGALASLDPMWSFIGMPYLFQSYESAEKLFEGPTASELLNLLPKYDLIGLSFFSDGFRDVTNSRRPIVEPADLAGLKIRVVNSPAWIATFRALGANPTPMDFGQVYMALKTRVVDAQEAAPTTTLMNKFYEGQAYLSLTRHIFQPVPLIAGKKFWDGLPNDVQVAMQKAAPEATRFQRQLIKTATEASLDQLRTRGMKINEVDKPAFIKATASVYSEVEANVPGLADLIAKIRAAQA